MTVYIFFLVTSEASSSSLPWRNDGGSTGRRRRNENWSSSAGSEMDRLVVGCCDGCCWWRWCSPKGVDGGGSLLVGRSKMTDIFSPGSHALFYQKQGQLWKMIFLLLCWLTWGKHAAKRGEKKRINCIVELALSTLSRQVWFSTNSLLIKV